MTAEQKKVSLTIETDWLTFQYVDQLSKTIETIQQSIDGIQQQTANRFEELREWSLEDPTEWLEDVEDELKGLRKKIKELKVAQTEELKVQQQAVLEELAQHRESLAKQFTEQKSAVVEGQQLLKALLAAQEQNFSSLEMKLMNRFDAVVQENEQNVKAITARQQQLEEKVDYMKEAVNKLDSKQSQLGLDFAKMHTDLTSKIDNTKNEIIEILREQFKKQAPIHNGGSDDGEK